MTGKERLFRILEGDARDDRAARAFSSFIVTLILLNVVALILETVDAIAARWGTVFIAFEAFSVAVFTVEYGLRIWSAPVDPRYRSPVAGRFRFATSPLAIIDLLAILPAYLALAAIGVGADLRFLRLLRLFRLLRVFKLGRYSESLRTLRNVLVAKREQLTLAVVVVAVLLIVTSGLMYAAEQQAQPEAFGSIPAAMWWAIITLTSIGYGDVYPVTFVGRVLGGVTAILGVGMVAIPTAILATGFIEEVEGKKAGRPCPHCGRDVDAPPEPAPVAVTGHER